MHAAREERILATGKEEATAPPPIRADPLPGFNFRVEIDGIALASFAEVSGLISETAVIEYRTGETLEIAHEGLELAG